MIEPVVYIIDYLKLGLWLLPSYLRQTKTIALLNIAISPVIYLYQHFLNYRKNKLYELSINSQVCRLEALLNDRWDFTSRGIYIDDALEYPPLYIYKEAELKPVFLYTEAEAQPKYLFTDGEGGALANDFIVFVPAAVSFDALEMRSLVVRFRLPGMKFKIQIY